MYNFPGPLCDKHHTCGTKRGCCFADLAPCTSPAMGGASGRQRRAFVQHSTLPAPPFAPGKPIHCQLHGSNRDSFCYHAPLRQLLVSSQFFFFQHATVILLCNYTQLNAAPATHATCFYHATEYNSQSVTQNSIQFTQLILFTCWSIVYPHPQTSLCQINHYLELVKQ